MDSKNNIQDISLATRLRKQNYEKYLDGSNASSIGVGSTVDPTLVLRDLAGYNKDSYNKDLDTESTLDESSNDLSTTELIFNSAKAMLRDMNEAQLSNTRGVLRREVLPNIDRFNSNLNLFSAYDNLMSEKNSLLNQLSTTPDSNEADAIAIRLQEVENKLNQTKEGLNALGVSPDLSNAQEIRAQQEQQLQSYKDRAQELYDDIATDEADIARYKVDERFQRAMEENSEFKWTEPSKWIYSVPSAVGSSSSAWMWQIAPYATTALKSVMTKSLLKAGTMALTGAAAGSVAPGAGTLAGGAIGAATGALSIALDLGNAAMMIYSNYKQAENEANANVSDDYRDRVSNILSQSGSSVQAVVNAARSQDLPEEFSNLTDDKLFEKILDGQIQIEDQSLSNAISQARQGLDRDFAQNMAITWASNLAEDALMVPYFGKIANGWIGKSLNTVAFGMNPVEGLGELAASQAKKKMSKYVLGRNAIDVATKKWANRAAKAAYVGTDLALRNAATAFNEAIEEGSQYTTGQAYKRGDFDSSDLDLEGLASSLVGAYKEKTTTVANILGSPFGYQNPLYENDTEYWNNVKLGAAASILSPIQGAVNARGAYSLVKETQGMDRVNELAANEINSKEEMEKAITYASGKLKGHEAEIVNAWSMLADGKTENLPEGFNREDALEEARFASRAFSLAKSKQMKSLAKTMGIEEDTEEYGILVGLAMQAEKEYTSSIQNARVRRQELDNAKNNFVNDPISEESLTIAIDDAYKRINSNATTQDEIVSKDELREIYDRQRHLNIMNNMITEIDTAINQLNESKNESEFRGNQYSLAKLEDMKYRLNARKKSILKSMPSWYKNNANTINNVDTAMQFVTMNEHVSGLNKATEDSILAELMLERNREILNSFHGIDNGRITPTEEVERENIIELGKTKPYKKSKKLRLTALRNIHEHQGDTLISEMFDLYQTKKAESKEATEGALGVTEQQKASKPVVPSKPVTAPTGPMRTEQQAAPEVEQKPTPQVRKSTRPTQANIASQELSEADQAIIAAAEGQDIGLTQRKQQPQVEPEVQPQNNDSAKTEPVETNDEILGADEDPFAGGTGGVSSEDVFNEYGGAVEESTKASKKAKESKPKATKTEQAKKDTANAKEEFNEAARNFFDLLEDDTLGFAFDPAVQAEKQAKIFKAFLTMLGKAFNLGAYKFKEVALNMYEAIGRDREKLSQHFDAIKGAYSTAYYNMPENVRGKMTTPAEVAEITVDDLFDPQPAELTEEEVNDAAKDGVIPTPVTPGSVPPDAISDAELAEFTENSELGILNTFHYTPTASTGEIIELGGARIQFSPNSELPKLFKTKQDKLTYEYSVAPYYDNIRKKTVQWNDPNTYDYARVGLIITNTENNKRYWVAMRSPNNIRNLTPEEYPEMIRKLRERRQEIISRFVMKDSNGSLLNEVDTRIKVTPTRLLLHNAIEGTISQEISVNDKQFKDVFQFSGNLDEEINNFGYSTGVRGTSTIFTVEGDNTGFIGTTSGGVYYIIDGKKRLSGRPLPLKLSLARFNSYPKLAEAISTIVFKSGFKGGQNINNTDLIASDIIEMFLNYGEPTSVNNDSDISDSAKANLRNKQLYIDNKGQFGVLHYGINEVSLAGLSIAQKEQERKHFEDWLLSNGSMPFKVPSKGNDKLAVNMKMNLLFSGRLASSVEKAGGRLELFDGIVFTREDMNHTLLSWMVRNGMIKSNLNAERYERPYVIADGMTQDMPTTIPDSTATPAIEEAPKSEAPKPSRRRRSFSDLSSMGGSQKEVKINFTPNKKYTTKEKLNKVQAKNFLKQKLGMTDAEINIIDAAVSSDMPATALSYMTKDSITLYNSDPAGVEFHEAYHRVSLLLLSDQERNKVYEEYRRIHPNLKNASDKYVEEALAEEFRGYMMYKTPRKSYRITKWFEKLRDFIMSLFGRTTPTKIFRGIYEGKYANIPVSQEAKDRFEKAYRNRVNFTQHGYTFQNIKSLDNYNQAVEFFAISYINQSLSSQSFVDDLTKIQIDYQDMRDLLEDLSYDDNATPEQRAAANELYEHFDIFQKDIKSYLDSLSLRQVKEEQEYDETEERDGGEIEKENFDKYDKASYEVSVLHNIRPAVKLFLSSIEDRVYDKATDSYVRDMNAETGIPRVTPFLTAWRRIVDKLFDEDTYDGLIRKSAQLAKTDPFYASVYNKLSSVKDSNLQTQIFQTITGYRHNFLTVGFQNVGTDTIQYIANLGGSVNLRNGKRLISDWNKNFFSSNMTITDADGNKKPNMELLKTIRDDINTLNTRLARMNESTSNEDFNAVLYSYVDVYNKIGIAINFDTLYQAIVDKVSSVNSVNKPTILQAAKELLSSNRDGSLAKAIPEILRRPVKDKPNDRIKRSIDGVFTGENSILNLAIIHYRLNNNNLEEKVLGPKNTTVYPLSKHNYLTLEIKKLNNDRNYVSRLLKCPINSSSLVYNALKNSPNTRLTVGTLLNITEYNSGNTGTDYQSAPKIETFISKFVLSEKDILILPTMSDKKTYMPIQGLKMFKGRTLNITPDNDKVKIKFSDDVLNQFYKYYRSEYDAILQYRRMKLAEDKIDDANRPTMYFGKRGEDNGKGGKFRIARGVYHYEDGNVQYMSFSSMSDKELMDYFKDIDQLKEDLNTTLQVFVDKQLDYVRKLGLIGTMIDSKTGEEIYTNKFLPVGSINERSNDLSNSIYTLAGDSNKNYRDSIAIYDAISTFTVNNFVSMFETEKILYKDVAFFKNYPDVSKRLAGTLSTGDRPRTDFSDPNHLMNKVARYKQGRYNVAGLKDVELRTNQPKELYKAIYDAYVRELMENSGKYTKEYIDTVFESGDLFSNESIPQGIKDKAKESTERDLSLYGDIKMNKEGNIEVNEEETPINQADASVYCSPTMYKAILASQGLLDPKVEEAIDYVEQHADDLGDIRKYVNTLSAVLSPKKMVYFGNEILQPIPGEFINMPIFNKMAIFPLFKVLATGDLRVLYDRMNDVNNPIDMFTTKSAVKVGNIKEYDFYTDATQNEITEEFKKDDKGTYSKPIVYRQQNFGNLLNQMPIEAHDAEKRMLVTQAMKTVFSNIRLDGDYFIPSSSGVDQDTTGRKGKKVSGRQLVKLAMDAIDNLSDRGLNRILKDLHAEKNEDGTYSFKDLQGISDKLVRDMISSNMDSDIIDQVTLDETGNFKVPLSASPVAKQLVTKIISAVNKETVDINLPGGTFVQMSSFGLKSIDKVKASEAGQYSKYQINNGERLKLIADDRSMECVISINLLKHIIPGYENMSFLQARQWLMDNNIIGPNASPSAMAYRVPTQGMSSIAALTIKDVVMSQAGDIIILPDEFTARTGSDFDIDKLFLTRYNYTSRRSNKPGREATKDEIELALSGFNEYADEILAIKDGEPVTRRSIQNMATLVNDYLKSKNSNVMYDVTDATYKVYPYISSKTEFDYNKSMNEQSQGAIENLLIDTFMASLLDSKNTHDTTRPLDVPVNIMKNGIVKKYFPDKKNDAALYEYTEEYQDTLKQDFADSKGGIGPFALNNPHHVLGQLVELVMQSPEYLPNIGNLHKVSGVDDIHILDWLSALISAHVDVAKDNYIIKLNVNGFTYNLTNFLLRNGAGKNTMYFVSQEIMKDLANDYIQSRGVYGIDNTKPFYRRFQEKEKAVYDKFVTKAKSLAKSNEDKENLDLLLKNEQVTDHVLFEVPEQGKLGYLENLLRKANDKEKDFDYYYGQILVYKLFKEIEPMAQAMSDLVKASQVDTKKFGKNSIEMRTFLQNVADCYTSPYFTPEMVNKFFKETFLQKKIDNSIKFTLDLLGKINIQSSDEYYRVFRSLINASGFSKVKDKQAVTAFTNAIDSYWRAYALYDSTSSPLINSMKELRDLFIGPNTIAKRINRIKTDIISDAASKGGKYPIISVTNGRISNLFLNSITGVTDTTGKAIDYVRLDYSDDISSNASRQIREYWQELLDSDNQELHDLAYDLVRYAVFSGHGTKHLNSLFDFIPTRILDELGYYETVRTLEENIDNFSNLFTPDDVDEIYRNNWQDNNMVPVINTSNKGIYIHREKVGNRLVPVAIKGSSRRYVCKDDTDVPLYHPYVKMRDNNATGGYNLYKYVGTFIKDDGKTKTYKPLYILVNKKGFRQGGKGFVSEYLSPYTTGSKYISRFSIIPGNNVAPRFAKYDNNFLEDIPDIINNEIVPKINSQTNKVSGKPLSGVFYSRNTIDYMFNTVESDAAPLVDTSMDENGEVVESAPTKPLEQFSDSEPVTLTRKTYSGLIQSLAPNQIFVFGSNTQGRHGKGAALTARNKFGAKYGQAEGPQGQSYAIITKDLTKRTHPSRTVEQIKEQIHKLYEYARQNPDKEFLVAYSGKGTNLNAYSNQEMADMFSSEPIPNNIVFEQEFNKLIPIESTQTYTEQPYSNEENTINEFNNENEFSTDEMNHCIKQSYENNLS